MLFAYLDLLEVSFKAFLAFFAAVLVALAAGITFHEFSHALTAERLGDATPRRLGRVSLNPLAHLDPAGTLFLFFAGFGWGKPVPVNAYALRNGAKAGMATVAAAGPVANLAMAAVFAVPINAGLLPWRNPFIANPFVLRNVDDYLGLFISSIVIFSVFLAVFNLIPLAPLDGFRVAVGILPPDLSRTLLATERYGPVILLSLIFLPFFLGANFSPLHEFMRFLINPITRFLTGVNGDVIG